MSFHVFFSLSVGLEKPICVPKGTLADIMAHVSEVEKALDLKAARYLDNPPHWARNDFKDVDDEVLCREAERHNSWVRRIYRRLGEWAANPVQDGETITPEQAAKFWHGLEMIDVPPERWSRDYYVARMEAIYEAMRGRRDGAEGMIFDAKPLSPEQADRVLNLFAAHFDAHDTRLSVCVGHDSLQESGDYDWCSKCGAIHSDEAVGRARHCRKRGCPLKEDLAY